MPKAPQKSMQKKRTEVEMRQALIDLVKGNAKKAPQDDAPIDILSDVIEEILESRQLIEEIKNFVQVWAAKFQRK
jgi:hypothetical protein